MRIFNDPEEMVKEVERDLTEMGTVNRPESMQDKDVRGNDDFCTLELQAYGYTLVGVNNGMIDNLVRLFPYLNGCSPYAESEFLHRVNPRYINPGSAWKHLPEVWEQFIREGKFSYTYNERYREQLPQLILELDKRPGTRQAVMTMYDRHQDMNNWGGRDRIPCSMYYQFMVRDGKLHVIYTMRSCDFLTHFIHDVYFTLMLQAYIAGQLGIEAGNFTHFMGSLHAYQKDLTKRGVY